MRVPYAEVIGDPIGHSKSPLIHKFWLGKLGIEGDYRATRIVPAELPDYLTARRADPDWRGCNLTMPQSGLCSRSSMKSASGWEDAVNCVVPAGGLLIGLNTIRAGLPRPFRTMSIRERRSAFSGAGGAARAAIAYLDVIAVYQFHLIARDREEAGPLLAPYGEHGRWFDFDQAALALAGCVGVINATPLGMTGFPPMPIRS